jgi:hypothetical protein
VSTADLQLRRFDLYLPPLALFGVIAIVAATALPFAAEVDSFDGTTTNYDGLALVDLQLEPLALLTAAAAAAAVILATVGLAARHRAFLIADFVASLAGVVFATAAMVAASSDALELRFGSWLTLSCSVALMSVAASQNWNARG